MLLPYNCILRKMPGLRIFQLRVRNYKPGSLLATIAFAFIAHIAQTVEHFLGKEEVTGSSPVMGSRGHRFKFGYGSI